MKPSDGLCWFRFSFTQHIVVVRLADVLVLGSDVDHGPGSSFEDLMAMFALPFVTGESQDIVGAYATMSQMVMQMHP